MRGDQGDEGALAERAALIALLRAGAPARPWSEITADVVEAGSALAVWQRQAPAALMWPGPAERDALAAAAEQISSWARQGWRLATILDADYPARLREIHQAPPVLFSRGMLIRRRPRRRRRRARVGLRAGPGHHSQHRARN